MLLEKAMTGSTNDDARTLGLAGAAHGTTLLAREQRSGRGRAGRSFASPTGGLYLSVLVRPKAPPPQWSVLPLVAGAAAACALRGRAFPVDLKWPNDIMIGGRKLGGILAESHLGPDPFAVIGFGLNMTAVPDGVAGATALAAHGTTPEPRALAESIREGLLARIARLDAGGPSVVLPEVRALCGTLGRRVAWEEAEGIAMDVADDGALVIDVEGAPVRVTAGDVSIRAR